MLSLRVLSVLVLAVRVLVLVLVLELGVVVFFVVLLGLLIRPWIVVSVGVHVGQRSRVLWNGVGSVRQM